MSTGESEGQVDTVVLDEELTVDPSDVDWDAVYKYGNGKGSLTPYEKTEAVRAVVDEVSTEQAAERLIGLAADEGLIEITAEGLQVPTAVNGQSSTTASSNGTGTEAQPQTGDIAPEEIDWVGYLDEYGAGPHESLPSSGQRKFTLALYVDAIQDESHAEELISQAIDDGVLVRENTSLYLAPERRPSRNKSITPSAGDTSERELHSAVENLREDSSGTEDYVRGLEDLVTTVLDRIETVENRQDKLFENHRRHETALNEIQVQRLKRGEPISRDGVDVERLERELDLDLIIVGENNDIVRLKDQHLEDPDKGSTALPDFSRLCLLEELRIKHLLGMMSREQIERSEGKNVFRAMVVWSDAELLDTASRDDEIAIPTSKVKTKLDEHEDFKPDSLRAIANTVLDTVARESEGVFELKTRDNRKHVVAAKEVLVDAKISRFQRATVSDDLGETGDDNETGCNSVITPSEGVALQNTGR